MEDFFDSGDRVQNKSDPLSATLNLILFLLDMIAVTLHDAVHELLALLASDHDGVHHSTGRAARFLLFLVLLGIVGHATLITIIEQLKGVQVGFGLS